MTLTDSEIYKLMHTMGDHKIRKRFLELRDSGRICDTSIGSTLAAQAGGKVYASLLEFYNTKTRTAHGKRVRQMMKLVGVDRCAAIALRVLIGGVAGRGDNRTLGSVLSFRKAIGRHLAEEADFATFELHDKKKYKYESHALNQANPRQRKRIKNKLLERLDCGDAGWDAADCVLIGSVVLSFCLRDSGLFTTETSKTKDHYGKSTTHNTVRFTDEVQEWIAQGLNFLAACVPIRLPITTIPLDWGPNQPGGYPEDMGRPLRLMTTPSREQYRKLLESDCPMVYQGLNTLQRTPWRVNKRVAEMVELSSRHGWEDTGFYPEPPQKPARPSVEWDETSTEWREYMRLKRAYDVARNSHITQQLEARRAVSVLEAFRDLDRFYYPHQLDFRGRCYTIGSPVNYQGPDYQRGSLEFADAKPLGSYEGIKWFLIHGANCWGEDKVSLEDRVAWVAANQDWLVQCAENPIDDRRWTEADKPFQFLAWLYEYAEFVGYSDKESFPSRIAINMDGSNNGLQIYSLLLRDEVGGFATNCTPGPVPQDAYQEVTDLLTVKLREYIDKGDDEQKRRWARRILEFCKMTGSEGLPRAAVKRPVMTLPYGAKQYSCQKYLVEWYHEFVRGRNIPADMQPFPERDVYNALNWVGSVLWECIGETVVKASEAMAWLRSVSDVLSEHNLHAEWLTPLEMRCVQHYVVSDTQRIRMRAGGHLKLTLLRLSEQVASRESRNGLCPNFIHSLDAAAMLKTVCNASEKGVTHFQMIHDSYGTHAADAPIMATTLRETFVDMFSEDVLGRLHSDLQALLPDDVLLPDPPAKGNLEVDNLLEADYFFA